MGVLTLVRHGQASFFADDYDQLSAVGQTQARLLGEYWARRGIVLDEVYTGPRLRQQQTAELAGAAYEAAGMCWPEPAARPEFDEYDFLNILRTLAPVLAGQNAEFGGLLERFQQSSEDPERTRSFQRMFETLMIHWLTVAAADGLETWLTFQKRVRRGLGYLIERPGRGRRVAVFTSGGFTGTAVQLALGAPERTALELNWRVRNGSLTEFVFTRGRLTLDGFNAVPHLEDPALWTYR